MLAFLGLTILSLGPIIYYLRYLRYMDRAEPEPLDLVLKVMAWGACSVIPVVIIGLLLRKGLLDGKPEHLGEIFLHAFVVIAVVEELAKLVAGLWPVWNDPNFNEENDGIVYVTASSLGFAAVENFLYVLQFGIGTGIVRAIISVPAHMSWGILMGYYAGLAKFAPPGERARLILKGYLSAVVLHGLFDAFLMSEIPLLVLIMFFGAPVYIWKTINRLLEKGRQLSIQRLEAGGGVIPLAPEAPVLIEPSPVKLYLARALYLLSAGFWGLIFLGLSAGPGPHARAPHPPLSQVLLGSVVLTAPFILVGWLLSGSYWHHYKRYLRDRPQALPPCEPPEMRQ